MTPQAFSYATVTSNKQIYIPPYGLTENVAFVLKIDPISFDVKKIPINKSEKTERWTFGVEVNGFLYFFPYNEDHILVINLENDSIEYIYINWPECTRDVQGKYISFHIYEDRIISLPYGEKYYFDHVLIFNTKDKKYEFVKLELNVNDYKKWHTSQLLDQKIYAVPRGERWTDNYFPYAIDFNCKDYSYNLVDMSKHWGNINLEQFSNKKHTTLAKANEKLYAPPYSENPNFDTIAIFKNKDWHYFSTGLIKTSRKYYSHVVAKNGKIYFPPAGHDEDWSELLIIDSETDNWYVKDLKIRKESKKYFSGVENSQGKIYYIPRGGCACMPTETWKKFGDLAEILVIDTNTDSHYTIDISEYFLDNTTIEKYNCCIIVDDIIYAFPYGESETFHTLLIFNTITEKVIKTIDFNEI
jgi:hypothetical protein